MILTIDQVDQIRLHLRIAAAAQGCNSEVHQTTFKDSASHREAHAAEALRRFAESPPIAGPGVAVDPLVLGALLEAMGIGYLNALNAFLKAKPGHELNNVLSLTEWRQEEDAKEQAKIAQLQLKDEVRDRGLELYAAARKLTEAYYTTTSQLVGNAPEAFDELEDLLTEIETIAGMKKTLDGSPVKTKAEAPAIEAPVARKLPGVDLHLQCRNREVVFSVPAVCGLKRGHGDMHFDGSAAWPMGTGWQPDPNKCGAVSRYDGKYRQCSGQPGHSGGHEHHGYGSKGVIAWVNK